MSASSETVVSQVFLLIENSNKANNLGSILRCASYVSYSIEKHRWTTSMHCNIPKIQYSIRSFLSLICKCIRYYNSCNHWFLQVFCPRITWCFEEHWNRCISDGGTGRKVFAARPTLHLDYRFDGTTTKRVWLLGLSSILRSWNQLCKVRWRWYTQQSMFRFIGRSNIFKRRHLCRT